jgi:hypothetical protein
MRLCLRQFQVLNRYRSIEMKQNGIFGTLDLELMKEHRLILVPRAEVTDEAGKCISVDLTRNLKLLNSCNLFKF